MLRALSQAEKNKGSLNFRTVYLNFCALAVGEGDSECDTY